MSSACVRVSSACVCQVRVVDSVDTHTQVEVDDTQTTATRVTISALTDKVRTVYAFVFPALDTLNGAGIATLKFAITTPRWRNSSAPPNIITGVCMSSDESSTLHLSVYSLYLNHSFHTKIYRCERCCDPAEQSKMHAHIDVVQGKLVLVSSGVLNTVSLLAPGFTHMSYKFRTTDVSVHADPYVVLGNFSVAHAHVCARTVFPTSDADADGGYPLHVFVLARHADERGTVFAAVSTATTTAGGEYSELLQLAHIEAEVQEQLSRDHFSASHVLESTFALHAESFVLLNNWDYNITQRLQPLPPTLYVVFSCTVWHTPGAAGVGMRLFVHVAVDTWLNTQTGSMRRTAVTVLGAAPMPTDAYFVAMGAPLAPLYTLGAHPSVLVAQSLIVVVDVVASGRGLSVQSMTLSCAGCSGSDGRVFNRELNTCVCPSGSVSVCVPCTDTMQCSLHQFTFDATRMENQTCRVRPLPRTQDHTLYYEVCVRCQKHSRVYCPDGAAPQECPAATPYTRVEGAVSIGECTCGHNYTHVAPAVVRRADGHMNFYGCPEGRMACGETCVPCTSTAHLCNPLLPDNFKVVTCPPHTRAATTETVYSNYVTRVEQACVCENGFRRTRTAAAYYSQPSLIDANVYSASWSAAHPDFQDAQLQCDRGRVHPVSRGTLLRTPRRGAPLPRQQFFQRGQRAV